MKGWTERELLDLLWARLTRAMNGETPRYVMAEHARYSPTYGHRIADALAIDTWGSGHHQLEGYEVKVSRSDWRRELADPTKAECWGQHCSRWYVLAPSGIVRRDELPDGWGLIEASDRGQLRCTVPSSNTPDVTPLAPQQIAGLMRATQQTAQRHARTGA